MDDSNDTKIVKREEITLMDILEKAGPLVKDWQESEVSKLKISLEMNNQALANDFKFKKFLVWALGIGLLVIIGLSVYLFSNNKDGIASNLLTITLTGIISFIGGYGLGKSNLPTSPE